MLLNRLPSSHRYSGHDTRQPPCPVHPPVLAVAAFSMSRTAHQICATHCIIVADLHPVRLLCCIPIQDTVDTAVPSPPLTSSPIATGLRRLASAVSPLVRGIHRLVTAAAAVASTYSSLPLTLTPARPSPSPSSPSSPSSPTNNGKRKLSDVYQARPSIPWPNSTNPLNQQHLTSLQTYARARVTTLSTTWRRMPMLSPELQFLHQLTMLWAPIIQWQCLAGA